MPDPVGEAFVDVRPDLSKFTGELESALRNAVIVANRQAIAAARATTAQGGLRAAFRGTKLELKENAAAIEAASTQLNRFSRGVASTALSMFGLRGATLAATSAFLAGAAAITAIGKAVGFATKFTSQLAVFQATTGASADELARASEAAKALGRDLTLPGVTAGDAAEAMTELAKAGLSVDQAIAAARGTLQLAIAANIDFAQSTELVASALNAFGLNGREATKVADTLANAANSAQGSIVDVGIAFQQAASVGHQVGLSFRDTTLFITELAKAGLTGSDAGTSLRTALIRLINPTKQAQETFKRFGIEVRDAQGNLRPDFFVNLGTALRSMSRAQRDATLAQIGGQDAVRALSILTRQNIEELLAQRDALDQQGTAARVAGARLTGLAGAGANLSNTIESIALGLGQRATPALVGLTNALTNTVQAVATSPLVTGTLAGAASATADAFGALGDVIKTLVPLLQPLASGLNAAVSAVGIGTILATVVAFKALRAAFAGLAAGATFNIFSRIGITVLNLVGALNAVRVAFLASTASGIGFRNVLLGLSEGFGTLVTRTGFVVAALTTAVGLIVFFASRASETERATRRLTDSVRDLGDALGGLRDAQRSLGDLRRAVASDEVQRNAARLAVAQAKQAESAARLSGDAFKLKQAQNGVAIAEQNLLNIEHQLAEESADLTQARRRLAQVERNVQDELTRTRENVLAVVSAEEERAQRGAIQPVGTRARELEVENEVRKQLIQSLREQEKQERRSAEAGAQDAADRLKALADILEHTRELGNLNRTSAILFSTGPLQHRLEQLRTLFAREGRADAAAYVLEIENQLGLLAPKLQGPIAAALDLLKGIARSKGQEAGQALGQGILAGVLPNLSFVGGLLQSVLGAAVGRLSNQVGTLLTQVSTLQVTGGSLPAQLTVAQDARRRALRELNLANQAVRDAQKVGGDVLKRAQERRDQALAQAQSAQGEVARVQGEQAAQTAEAERKRDEQVRKAKEARDKADQDQQDLLTAGEARFAIQRAKAEATEGLVDDVRFFQEYQRFLIRQIAVIQNTIHDERTKAQILQALHQALVETNISLKQTLKQQAEQRRQRIIDRRDRQQENLELNVEIAQAQSNTRKELQAHEALLRFLIARQKHTDAGTLEWRRLQLKVEQERAAIKELRKAQAAATDEQKALQFEFLQAQQGFAATVLSNILPLSTVAGSVQGGAITTGTGRTVPLGSSGQIQRRGLGDFEARAFAQGAGGRGATAGQASTQIDVLRQILFVLRRLAGDTTHPEANTHRVITKNTLDTTYGV